MFGGPSGKLPTSVQPHNFSQVPASHLPRSAFDRSHPFKMTCQASQIVPIFVDEVLPGDTFSLNSTIFARLATPIVPAMDNLEVTTQFFFVPNRLVWDNWEKFCGAQDNPGDSISYTIPQIGPAASFAVMTLPDYMGLAPGFNYGGTAGYLSALPFRAYNRIWNEWYRDENLQNSLTLSVDDGPDPLTDYVLQLRGQKKDYFYGALTTAQKGSAVPFLTGTARVYGPAVTETTGSTAFQMWNNTDAARQIGGIEKQAATLLPAFQAGWTGLANTDTASKFGLGTSADYTTLGAGYTAPYADLSTNATDVINTLRLAFQTQKFLERDARGGTRYTELNLSHFGVTNPDARLQRTEYLGGGMADLNITPIPQTAPANAAVATTRIGDLYGFGTSLSNRNGFTKSFTEHGHILGFINIRVKNQTYQQGYNKLWARQTRYDFYWPVFANLGEQTVLRKEIYYVGDKATTNLDDTVWGYQERWAEYRHKPGLVAGIFRSAAASTLDYWHFAQNYASAPSLNSTWIPDQSVNVIDRNLNVTHSATVAQFKVDIWHTLHCARVMPVNSVPGNIDRF
nr:MAG TPA: Capsid protein [Microviridae sp.]